MRVRLVLTVADTEVHSTETEADVFLTDPPAIRLRETVTVEDIPVPLTGMVGWRIDNAETGEAFASGVPAGGAYAVTTGQFLSFVWADVETLATEVDR